MKVSRILSIVSLIGLAGLLPAQSALANNVTVTPLGSMDGEFCQLDRALVFEDPDGTRLLYDPGRTVAGADRFGDLELGYLRGAAGHLLVADGTRADTVQAALALKQQAVDRYGERPFVMLLNKADLEESWEIPAADAESLEGQMDAVFVTSAKTGANVAEAIECLGQLVAAREFGSEP